MFILFFINIDGLNLTTFRAEILASTLVLGLRPTLAFLFKTWKVPNDDILILFDLINSEDKYSKKSSIIADETFLEKPKVWYILLVNFFLV